MAPHDEHAHEPDRAPEPEPDHGSARDRDHLDLLSTLEVIEAQPLATRAEAYDALHDTLARRLEAVPNAAPPQTPGLPTRAPDGAPTR